MIPPLVVEFMVATEPAHAFETWTARGELWWPKGHTVTGDPAAIVFEPRAGGEIFETGVDGSRHAWGEVLVWEPPHRVEYLWHLFFPRAEATKVSLTFIAFEHGTRVRLEQTGWDALGPDGVTRRERTNGGWAAVSGAYRAQFSNDEGETRSVN